jgi:hypothetical protein
MRYACAITTPLIQPNMVYARHPVGWNDVRYSRMKNGQSVVTVRISPDATADKARLLESCGWQVHITDSIGRQFGVSEFYLEITVERFQ